MCQIQSVLNASSEGPGKRYLSVSQRLVSSDVLGYKREMDDVAKDGEHHRFYLMRRLIVLVLC